MKFSNQKGMTLVEVLLSIVILTIVLTSIMNFFPQMGQINKQNLAKTNGMNVAKQELMEWQNDKNIQKVLAGKTAAESISNYKKDDSSYYYFEKELDGLHVEVKIKKKSDLDSNPSKAHYIRIILQNDQDKLVSETYGYIIYDTGDF